MYVGENSGRKSQCQGIVSLVLLSKIMSGTSFDVNECGGEGKEMLKGRKLD